MRFSRCAISDVVLIVPEPIGDSRGYFMETYRKDLATEFFGDHEFVQVNQSLSANTGTIRGLHYQRPPKAQGKLVRCLAGQLLDVAVDIRSGSPSFGRHVAVELSAENGHQLWIPAGFAHGFCTLRPNTLISYMVTDHYSPQHDAGLLWNDPDLDIAWPPEAASTTLSEKDLRLPILRNTNKVF